MRTRTPFVLLACLAVGACQDTTDPGQLGLTPEEAALLAEAITGTTFDATSDLTARHSGDREGPALPSVISATVAFNTTSACELGGEVAYDGTRVREWDLDARTMTDDYTGTRDFDACAGTIEPEEGPVAITLDGSVAVDAHLARTGWEPDGVQTMTMLGELDWATDDGRAGTCPVDVQARFDPDTRTQTVEGVFCDTVLDNTTTWD